MFIESNFVLKHLITLLICFPVIINLFLAGVDLEKEDFE